MSFDITELLSGTDPSGILFMVSENCFGLFSELGDAVPSRITSKWNPLSDGKIELECIYPLYPPLQLYNDPFNKLVDNGNIEVYGMVS